MKGQNKSNMSSFQFAEKKSDMKILLHKETEFKITLLTSISDISTYHLNTYVRKVQIIVRAIRRVFRADGNRSRGGKGVFPPLQVLAGIETKPSPSKCFGLLLAHSDFQTFLWPCVVCMHIKISHYHIIASANTRHLSVAAEGSKICGVYSKRLLLFASLLYSGS